MCSILWPLKLLVVCSFLLKVAKITDYGGVGRGIWDWFPVNKDFLLRSLSVCGPGRLILLFHSSFVVQNRAEEQARQTIYFVVLFNWAY